MYLYSRKMMVFGAFVVLLSLTGSPAFGGLVTNVPPQHLDMLLNTKQYEEFARLMGIENVNLVIPKEGERTENPMFNKALEFGDIMMGKEKKELARQGLRFDRYPDSKWPNQRVPYYVKPDDYNDDQKRTINNAINRWNQRISCIKLSPWRNGDRDYVYVYSGDGCWSYLGKQDNGQYLSLQANGCVWQGTVIHEFMHAIGFAHEHNRNDRDNSVDILWNNIPKKLAISV